jgi:hypothetical protein
MPVDSLGTSEGLIGQEIPADNLHEGKRVQKNDLINILNYINFQNGTILANFRNSKYGNIVSVKVWPQPCKGSILDCLWKQPKEMQIAGTEHHLEHLLVSDGQNLVQMNPEICRMDPQTISFVVPEGASEKVYRKIKRFQVEDIDAKLVQNGASFEGVLVDFNAVSFRVELAGDNSRSFHWINPDQGVLVMFSRNNCLLYSGDCTIIRHGKSSSRRWFVLTPRESNISRFRKKEYRSVRHHTVPPVNLSFRHPLSGKQVFLQSVDISSTGLAVDEHSDTSNLIPGMMIPELSLEIAGNTLVQCSAQVLYRNTVPASQVGGAVRCGLVLLDMRIQDQAKLSALLHQAMNPNSFVCNQVDADALWQFFFDSGFIYPSKYSVMEAKKEDFKRTYQKLYQESPSIARHFVFQDKGSLFGHMSMLRFYSKAWMIHHHSSSRKGHAMAGLTVLEQVSSYVNEFHSLLSTNMNYVFCYYRPENSFPNRIFGGVAKDMANPKGSSVDSFGYLQLSSQTAKSVQPGQPYQLMPVNDTDLDELERFYETKSGGLLLDALDLRADLLQDDEINKEYQALGFKREKQVYALKQEGRLRAVIMVTLSDTGLNLSNLTNCIHAIVIDNENLQGSTLMACLQDLRMHHRQEELPLLVYPHSYLEMNEIAFEKKYCIWVLNMQNTDGYFRFLRKTFRRANHG